MTDCAGAVVEFMRWVWQWNDDVKDALFTTKWIDDVDDAKFTRTTKRSDDVMMTLTMPFY